MRMVIQKTIFQALPKLTTIFKTLPKSMNQKMRNRPIKIILKLNQTVVWVARKEFIMEVFKKIMTKDKMDLKIVLKTMKI